MRKLSIIAITAGLAGAMAACSPIQQTGLCDDQQTIGCAPYTDERTVYARPKAPMPEPTPEPVAPAPAPQPAPEPMPEPVIDDTPVMQSAEPQFKQISK